MYSVHHVQCKLYIYFFIFTQFPPPPKNVFKTHFRRWFVVMSLGHDFLTLEDSKLGEFSSRRVFEKTTYTWFFQKRVNY